MISSLVILFGSELSILIAIEQLVKKNRNMANVLLFFYLICTGLIQLGIGLIVWRIPFLYNGGFLPFAAIIFCYGPINLLYYHSLLEPNKSLPYRLLIHFLPAVLVVVGEIFLLIGFHDRLNWLISSILNDPLHDPLALVLVAGAIHITAYLLYLLKIALSLLGNNEIKNELRIVLTIDTLAIVSTLMISTGLMTRNSFLLLSAGILVSALHVFFFLAEVRYPDFFQRVGREIRSNRYAKNLLHGLNTEMILARLQELMEKDYLYRDPDLNLSDLAEKLLITPQQLSQFLNDKLNQNFRGFINMYRVEEAKLLLTSVPQKSVIHICYEVGFNSKSGFNLAFKKLTGQSPTDYRSIRPS
ncbi:MAG: helix-turn-helix domain-containing protein [Acidobacteriota bacterium]